MILSLVPSLSIAQSEILPSDKFLQRNEPMPFKGWAVADDIYRVYRADHETVPYLNQRLLEQEVQFHPETLGFRSGFVVGSATMLIIGALIFYK